jgi:hypothetical protein
MQAEAEMSEALEKWITRVTPAASAASSTCQVPSALTAMICSGAARRVVRERPEMVRWQSGGWPIQVYASRRASRMAPAVRRTAISAASTPRAARGCKVLASGVRWTRASAARRGRNRLMF